MIVKNKNCLRRLIIFIIFQEFEKKKKNQNKNPDVTDQFIQRETSSLSLNDNQEHAYSC